MEAWLHWYFLLPVGASVLSAGAAAFVMAEMGYSRRELRVGGAGTLALTTALAVAWSAVFFPLPVYYLLFYLFQAMRFLGLKERRTQDFFLINLGYVNTMAVHLILIGLLSAALRLPMRGVLADPFWRAVSVAAAAGFGAAESLVAAKWPAAAAALSADSESEEGRLFMGFLWFSIVYLLLDCLLCEAVVEGVYTPLFLIGSCIVLAFLQLLFLGNIHSFILGDRLRDEHEALETELAQRDESAGALRRISEHDSLTGVFSRRYAMDRLACLLKGDEAFSLVYLDLDHLKQINDGEGHQAGDEYLAGFSRALGARLRGGDLLARLGGDEFMILMPGCSREMAERRMADIRRSLLDTDIPGRFHFSFGVAGRESGGIGDADALLQAADLAMYADKQRAR